MNTSGWLFLMLSWAGILGLAVFCFVRIFQKDSGLD